MQCFNERRSVGDDEVGRQLHHLRRISPDAVDAAVRPALLDPDVATVDPAELLQAFPERGDAGLSLRLVFGNAHKHADASHAVGLLRARGEWPRHRCATEKRNELASFHVRSQAQETALYRLKSTLTGADIGFGRRFAGQGVHVRVGSKASLTAPKSDFRFTPESGLKSDIAPCPRCANNGHASDIWSSFADRHPEYRAPGSRG